MLLVLYVAPIKHRLKAINALQTLGTNLIQGVLVRRIFEALVCVLTQRTFLPLFYSLWNDCDEEARRIEVRFPDSFS